MSKTISMIVVSSNQPKQTDLCLQSLVEQDVVPFSFDVQLCDDGEVDLTYIVEKYRGALDIQYRVLTPRSSAWRLAANRNMGLRHCRGKRALIVDADCILAPTVLRVHELYADRLCVVGGRRRHVPEPAVNRVYSGSGRAYDRALKHCTSEETRHWNEAARRMILDHVRRNEPEISKANSDWISGFQVSYPVPQVRRIGGFWEAFTDYGGEEMELNRRLMRLGHRFVLRVDAVSFHLDHPINPRRASKWWYPLLEESARMACVVRNGGPILPNGFVRANRLEPGCGIP